MVHSDFSHEGSGSAMGWSQSSSVDPQDPAHAREIERLRTENAQLKAALHENERLRAENAQLKAALHENEQLRAEIAQKKMKLDEMSSTLNSVLKNRKVQFKDLESEESQNGGTIEGTTSDQEGRVCRCEMTPQTRVSSLPPDYATSLQSASPNDEVRVEDEGGERRNVFYLLYALSMFAIIAFAVWFLFIVSRIWR